EASSFSSLLIVFSLVLCSDGVRRFAQRFVNGLGAPQPMHQHSELAGHRHDCSLLSIRSSSCRDGRAVAAKIAVRTKRTEDVVGAVDKKTTQVEVDFLGDPLLWILVTGSSLSWCQTEPSAHRAAPSESISVSDRHGKGHCCQRPHTRDLREHLDLTILVVDHALHVPVVLLDLLITDRDQRE